MPHPSSNVFSTYVVSQQEEAVGKTLTHLNIAVLQNLRSQIAEQKLNLPFTPNDIQSYLQQEAYLRGQLDCISYILAEHEATQSTSQE
jgi:hypothetical protein